MKGEVGTHHVVKGPENNVNEIGCKKADTEKLLCILKNL